MARQFGLSKSKIAAFEQCPKRLWLATHRRDLAQQSDGAQARFAAGDEVGAVACGLLPNGTMVEAEPNLATALATTAALLAGNQKAPIFEATLEHDGVLVRIDILEPDGKGGWHLAEVKSTTKPKGYHVGDLATQLWVAREAGLDVRRASVRHIDTGFTLEREGEFQGLFTDADLMEPALALIDDRPGLVVAARDMLAGDEPLIEPGEQCKKPFPCEFSAYCQAHVPEIPPWPVTVLPAGGGKRWLALGVVNLLEVDAAALTNTIQKRVHRATLTGEPFHDILGARAAMADWHFPRTWLDFETIAFAVPRWVGTRPYEQIPFQFSAHLEQADGGIEHHEFLSLDGADPRRGCAEAIVAMVPAAGTVVAYNASFEKGRLLELAAAFPDLARALSGIADRLVDLLPVTRANWYHRDQRGSWSIKAVLPTVAPELDYAKLEVGDGAKAQAAYLEAIAPDTAPDRHSQLNADLRKYCGLDTMAMIVLARHLANEPRLEVEV